MTLTVSGRRRAVVAGTAFLALTSGLALGTAAHAATASISIQSPTNGSTVSGTVNIHATAIGTSSSDVPSYIDFYIDASPATAGPTHHAPCNDGLQTCDEIYPWNTSGLSGSHKLIAVTKTASGAAVQSATVTVTVGGSSSGPTITITAPADGAVVKGTTDVTATASTTVNSTDYPHLVTFFLDGTSEGSDTCSSTTVCHAEWSWDTSSAVGDHTLTAKVVSNGGATSTSAPVHVTVQTSSKIVVTKIPTTTVGKRFASTGVVRSTASGSPAEPMVPVTVTMTPVGGSSKTVTTTTDAKGNYTASFTAVHNTTIKVAATGTDAYGATRTSYKQLVRGKVSCSWAKPTIKTGVKDTVNCTLPPGTPKRTRIVLQTFHGGGWAAVAHYRARGTSKAPLGFTFARHGRFKSRVLVDGDPVWALSTSKVFRVHVHGHDIAG